MRNKRLNVGLFVGDLKNDFDSAVTKGAMKGAEEYNANLMIFPGRYLKAQYHDLQRSSAAYQYNTMFSYANKCNLDVLLILLGTVGSFITEREKKVFLDMYKDIPVVLLASDRKGYASVNFDNKSGLRDGINSLIVEKGCRNIGMVSGPKTNADALERLEVYKKALAKHGIEYDERKVVYGNFSEYSEDVVSDLVTRNPNLDAICFANDQMAIGGYTVLKNKGYRVGEDIQVMGFDDSPASTMLVPNLTTVRADAVELGRRGVEEAVALFKTGVSRKAKVKTSLVKRRSTGYSVNDIFAVLDKTNFKKLLNDDLKAASNKFVDTIMLKSLDSVACAEFWEYCKELSYQFFEMVANNDKDKADQLIYIIDKMIATDNGIEREKDLLYEILDRMRTIVSKYMPENLLFADECLFKYINFTMSVYTAKEQKAGQDIDTLIWMSNSIAKDMLAYNEDDDMSYVSVTDKLERLGCKSAYLYTFSSPFINRDTKAWHDWQIPKSMLLKSYFHRSNDIQMVNSEEQETDAMDIYNNKFLPADRRYSLVVNNIFINEEQLGMLLLEVDHSQIYLLESIVGQLSSALKIIYMLKTQANIQRQLEFSLKKIKENNEILDTISKSDELTGVFNRRGFFDLANSMITDEKNRKKKAIMVFADLDNLKQINDGLGHDEGDFAIKSAAEILKESMRASDVVARIGGDEFAILAITDVKTKGEVIRNRIKKTTKSFNVHCDKKYYIGISVGYAEFKCGPEVELEKFLDKADSVLYEDKKNKRSNIMK